MRLETDLLQDSIASEKNVLARLFAVALYYRAEADDEDNALNISANARAVFSFVENPLDFKFDPESLEHRQKTPFQQGFIESGERIAKNIRDYQRRFAKSDDSFFAQITENVGILSILIGCIRCAVISKNESNSNDSDVRGYKYFCEYICGAIERSEDNFDGRAIIDFENEFRAYERGAVSQKPSLADFRRAYKQEFNRHEQKLRNEGHPYSQTTEEYKRYLLNNFKSVEIFGVKIRYQDILDIFIRVNIDKIEFSRAHTYIVGRSGSGKSELLKHICRFTQNGFVLIDPHGDLADEVSQNSFTDRVKRIAPHEKRFVVNPFDIEDKNDSNRELVAQEITDLIAELVEDSGLSRLMTTIIFPIVSTLLKLDYADFRMLSDCINPNTGKARLKSLRGFVDPHLMGIWGELESDTYDTSKQSVFNRLQSLLNYRLVAQTLCGRDDFSRAVEPTLNKHHAIAVSLPIPVIGEAVSVTIGRFLATRMQIWAKRRQRTEKSARHPVILIMDEFHNFMSHATAQTLDQYGRKFGLFMVLSHQHTAQLTDREIRGSILANTGNKIVGVCNHDTRQTMAKEMGVDAEEIAGLKTGFFVGKFNTHEPKKFYSRMIRPGKPEDYIYLKSANNSEIIDGWNFENSEYSRDKGSTSVIKNKPKPKFDL